MWNSPLADGLVGAIIGAILGSLIAGFFVLYQTKTLLNEERRTRDEERERETKSLAAALLWEIDDFYKQNIRDVCRALRYASPDALGYYTKSPTHKGFQVFEASANKIGLFDTETIQAVLGYYGLARAFMNTVSEYGASMDAYQPAMQSHLKGKLVTLLDQIKKTSLKMVPLTKSVCELLAKRAATEYKFEPPF